MEIELKALTPLWMGGVDQQPDRVHETGLIGSLRWWYEALVRGLGGFACDPTDEYRCPDQNGKHCVVCELFGCTGWARKFRLQVLDGQGRLIQGQLERNRDFKLKFFDMREMEVEEKWLLVKAIWIAAQYGALGGKTTLKPQQRPKVGDDYGIVLCTKTDSTTATCTTVENYLRNSHWHHAQTKLPDLRWFFFLKGGLLWRRQINKLIGLAEDGKPLKSPDDIQMFLQGRRGQGEQNAVSKKIFSFRADGGRLWGYARDREMRDEIIKRIKQELSSGNYTAKTGEEVLNEL